MTTTATHRVATSGAVAAVDSTPNNYNWIGWGIAWRNCWRGIDAGTPAVPTSPAVASTTRISEAPAASITKRVTL